MSDAVATFTDANFQAEVLASDVPVLVDFTAPWCAPCKAIAPHVAALAREYQGRVKVGALDADANPDMPVAHRVMGMPTLLVFKGGQEVGRLVGAAPKTKIAALLEKAL